MSHHHEPDFRLNTPEFQELHRKLDRRNFLVKTSLGLGALATGSLLFGKSFATSALQPPAEGAGNFEQEVLKSIPHLAPKAKRIVYLFMSGGPSQFETFDYKPELISQMGQNLPDSVRQGQRLTGMSASQAILPLAPSALYSTKKARSGSGR